MTLEQAKGVLAGRYSLEMVSAFELLRHRARSTGRKLSELAADVVSGRTDLG